MSWMRSSLVALTSTAVLAALNISSVSLSAGATMTINGKLELASVEETVTVVSQSPTIDLESAKLAVNWDHLPQLVRV